MTEYRNRNGGKISGAILIVIGGLLLLNNFDFGFWRINLFSLPIIFIVFAIFILLNNKRSGIGLFFLGWGTIGIIAEFSDISYGQIIRNYWPIILIVSGILILFKRDRSDKVNTTNEEVKEDLIDKFILFQDSTTTIKSNNFNGGKLTALFSGAKIDLRKGNFENGAILDVTTIFAGINIFLRKDQVVSFRATSIFGGYEDKRVQQIDEQNQNVLIIKGFSLFGGIEVKE